jgi:hypothetical protein
VNSADAWHDSNAWPNNPTGDMVPILEASVEAAKERHPSGKGEAMPSYRSDGFADVLTAVDRCDEGCSAAALYRLQLREMTLEFCHHHHAKHFPGMEPWGWKVTGMNASLHAELYRTS